MDMDELTPYVNTNKAAQILGITVDRLRLLARRGDVPSGQLAKGPRLYDPRIMQELHQTQAQNSL